jgi:hypothetical protein
MIKTTVIPKNTTLSVSIPQNYVGKKVYALIYTEEEITTDMDIKNTQKPSDFFGTLSAEDGEKLHAHVAQSRNEWNRSI